MPKQILLVDDSVTIQRVVELTFAREADYKVTAAKSADEGLAKARDLKPDIVLADAGMSGKSGYDLCAALRADGALSSVACLILTGNFSPYDEARGQKAGADGYVVKPFETQALIDKVADAIGRKGARAASPAAAATPPPTPARKDDSLEIQIEREPPPRPAPPPPAAVRPAPPPPSPAPPPPKPPTSPPMARTMMGMQSPVSPPVATPPKPMTPEPLSKPLSMVAAETAPARPAPSAPAAAKPAATPSLVPQMPRAPMIPNVPTPSAPAAAARPEGNRPPPPRATLMGIPTVNPSNLPPGAVALPPKPAAPWAPPVQAHPPAMAAAVSAVTERAVAEIGARGADHEAIAQLSREVIERIAWEVVPELAETIIREQLDRLVAERQK